MKSKLLFFDIDGTLVDCPKGLYKPSERTVKALDELKEKGHDVFLATGRCHCFILDSVLAYPFSGYVTCNGGHVSYKGKTVYKQVVPAEAIELTRKLCDERSMLFYFESNEKIYVKDKNDPVHIRFANEWGMKQEVCEDDFKSDEIESYIGMIVLENLEDVDYMREVLSPYFDIQGHQSPYSFDLTLKETSKGHGIKKLVEAMNLDIKDTIAFGDGRNDLEMIETVGTGIAMGNAVDELKEVADYITDSVLDEGIETALKHFKLID